MLVIENYIYIGIYCNCKWLLGSRDISYAYWIRQTCDFVWRITVKYLWTLVIGPSGFDNLGVERPILDPNNVFGRSWWKISSHNSPIKCEGTRPGRELLFESPERAFRLWIPR